MSFMKKHPYFTALAVGWILVGLDFIYLAFDFCNYGIWGIVGIAGILEMIIAPLVVLLVTRGEKGSKKAARTARRYRAQIDTMAINQMQREDPKKNIKEGVPIFVLVLVPMLGTVVFGSVGLGIMGVGVLMLSFPVAYLLILRMNKKYFDEFHTVENYADRIDCISVTDFELIDLLYSEPAICLTRKMTPELLEYLVCRLNNRALLRTDRLGIYTVTYDALVARYGDGWTFPQGAVLTCLFPSQLNCNDFSDVYNALEILGPVPFKALIDSVKLAKTSLNPADYAYSGERGALYPFESSVINKAGLIDGDLFICINTLSYTVDAKCFGTLRDCLFVVRRAELISDEAQKPLISAQQEKSLYGMANRDGKSLFMLYEEFLACKFIGSPEFRYDKDNRRLTIYGINYDEDGQSLWCSLELGYEKLECYWDSEF